MAILQSRDVDRDFVGSAPPPKLNLVRRPSALVVDILRRTNNFFLTGKKGLESIGINSLECLFPKLGDAPAEGEPDEREDNPNFDPQAAAGMAPKIAEVIILLSCDRTDLFKYAQDPSTLQMAVYEMMEKTDLIDLLMAMPDLKEQFDSVNRSATVIPKEKGSETEADEKKRIRLGSPPTS